MSRRLALLALPLTLGACLERTQPTVADAPRPVQVVKVALGASTETRDYVGLIRPRHEADVGFRTGGRIVSRLVDVGDRVTAGQKLARLDPADPQLSLQSAEADLASAQATGAQTASEAARTHTLAQHGNGTLSADDQAQMLARTARQRVASATAAVALARNKLDYATLLAPADGIVTAVLADPGTVVAEGAAVFRVADATQPEAEISLPESAVAAARGAAATVTLWARPDVALPVTLRELSPQAEAKLRTYAARFSIADPPDWIALGMTATVHMATGADAKVATLPATALIDRGDGARVWTVDPASGRLTATAVSVQRLTQDRALVAGLRDGDLVVSLGVQKLDPAAKVRIADIRPLGAE